jgi:hypothetical protein
MQILKKKLSVLDYFDKSVTSNYRSEFEEMITNVSMYSDDPYFSFPFHLRLHTTLLYHG